MVPPGPGIERPPKQFGSIAYGQTKLEALEDSITISAARTARSAGGGDI